MKGKEMKHRRTGRKLKKRKKQTLDINEYKRREGKRRKGKERKDNKRKRKQSKRKERKKN